jgi:sulfate permease, SulP family
VNGELSRAFPFLQWWALVSRRTQPADLMAGITGAIVVLPQGIAFASIAGLPPEYGLYSAIVPAIIAAVFGSSFHLISGPTTAISIVVFSKISTLAAPFTDQYIQLALSLTLLAGVFQLMLGLVRMGALVNFVSYSVLVGFTTGAAILIGTGQLPGFFGISVHKGSSFLTTWIEVIRSLPQANLDVLAVALGTLIAAALLKHYFPRLPGLAFGMVFGSLVAFVLDGKAHNLSYVGSLPSHLPPFSIPDLSVDIVRQLVPGALAVAMLGLAEAASIARSVATLSHQRTDNNQEFVGQGLSNIIGSFFSCYASSGSFTRTGVNYNAGAKTPMAAVYAALFLLLLLFAVAPLTAYLPLASMSGIILLVSFNLINYHHIKAIWNTSRSEAIILVLTFLSTLFLDLEFALFLGVLLSLLLYLNRTSHPHFITVTKSHDDGCFVEACRLDADAAECPQLKMVRIDGSIFFGAVNHISEEFHHIIKQSPEQCHILIIASGINFIDVSGCAMLFHESHSMYLEGRQLYLCSLKDDVIRMLERGECVKSIGRENIFGSKREAVEQIIHKMDPERCRACTVRVFQECEQRPGAQGYGKSE